jgi:hypothetical protein
MSFIVLIITAFVLNVLFQLVFSLIMRRSCTILEAFGGGLLMAMVIQVYLNYGLL